MSGSGSSRLGGRGYFIRRSGEQCDVIQLRSGNREVAIASGLALGDAEDLCISKIEALRRAGVALDRCRIASVLMAAPSLAPRL